MSLAMYRNMEVVSWKTNFEFRGRGGPRGGGGWQRIITWRPLDFSFCSLTFLQHLLKITQLEENEHGLPGRWRGATQKRWVGGRKSNSREEALNTFISIKDHNNKILDKLSPFWIGDLIKYFKWDIWMNCIWFIISKIEVWKCDILIWTSTKMSNLCFNKY